MNTTTSYRNLMTWDRVPGWLCDWHITGWFDSGLQHNPNPNLFGPKISTRWTEDHLKAFVPIHVGAIVAHSDDNTFEVPFALLSLTLSPILSLNASKTFYPEWQTRMEGINTDQWTKCYYAQAVVQSSVEQDAVLHFSGWDGCRLWINNELKFDEHSYHHVILDSEKVPFRLLKGTNVFRFQLDRDGMAARIELIGENQNYSCLGGLSIGLHPKPRVISHFVALARHACTLKIKKAFKGSTATDLTKWQKSFGAFYKRCLGNAPVRSKADLKRTPQKISATACTNYTHTRYHLPAEGNSEIPAFVLLPDAEKRNGRTLVIAHGHENPDVCAGVIPYNGPQMFVGKSTVNYAEQMAQRGFIVGLIHERNFGERRDYFGSQDACNVSGLQAQAMGYTLPRLHIADLQLLREFLKTLPEVDAQRIGLGGLSGGGSLSYLAGAFDAEFKAVAVFCGITRYEDYAQTGGCGMQVVPGLYPTGDVGEVLSLIAPRPLLVSQGRLDSTFNVVRVRSVVEDARRAYRAAGVEDRLQFEIPEAAHQFVPELAEQFFLKWL